MFRNTSSGKLLWELDTDADIVVLVARNNAGPAADDDFGEVHQ